MSAGLSLKPANIAKLGRWLELLAFLICLFWLARAWGQEPIDSRVAVLKTRTDQMERHIDNTDGNVIELSRRLDRISAQTDQMENDRKWEQRIALLVISLLMGSGQIKTVQRRAIEKLLEASHGNG